VDSHAADSAPAALADLIAAGLVSHEVIGDPGRLGAEAATLEVLCRLIAGPVWRIGAFHYAFRTQPGDLGGRLAELAPADWTAALEAALQAELGPDVVWASPVDILAAAEADLDQPLLLLRAQADAVGRALDAAPAGTRAVVQAGYAAEVARLTAGADAGGALDRRLAAIEIRQDRLLEMLAAQAEALAAVLGRLDARDAQLEAQAAMLAALGRRLERLAEAAGDPGAFQETLGLTLAEFLARIEARGERAEPARALS
jgi:hypothetical protein